MTDEGRRDHLPLQCGDAEISVSCFIP
jgi:hypothetical protein